MNKKILTISLLILVAIGGSATYLLSSSEGKVAKEEMIGKSAQETSIPNIPIQAKDSGPDPGLYVDYKTDTIAKTTGTKLLFFHAPWCPQCRQIESDIKAKGVPAGVTIIKTDYDTSQQLRHKYGVTLQTTFVRINDNGELVKKYVAYDDPTLSAVIKNLL